jgi:hypothetical protein
LRYASWASGSTCRACAIRSRSLGVTAILISPAIACATSLILIDSLAACLAGLAAAARRAGFKIFAAHA